MTGIFLKLLNMSIAASYLVLAVILLRLLLKKAPKWIFCVLWGMVALRLVIPVAVESTFSLIPSAEVIPQNIAQMEAPAIQSGIPAVNSAVNPLFTEYLTPEEGFLETALFCISAVWAVGVGLMLVYGVLSYLKIWRQVQDAVHHEKNLYICDNVDSPFILGVFAPRIYIPSGMEEAHLAHVLAHENVHIKRGDHWWKPLGYLLLTVYWFNPLLWVAYILLCRDIEMACDEKVIAGMDSSGKRGYSEALVACSVHRRMIMVCPVAFGEVSVKARIQGVIRYKKPAIWIAVAALTACAITAICFLTNPPVCAHAYQMEVVTEATCSARGVAEYTCTECRHMYTAPIDMLAHTYDTQTVILEPTCTKPGSARQTCADCGFVNIVELAVLPHTAGAPFTVEEPNCTQQGKRTATCTECAEVFLVEILAVNGVHDLKETVLREATCTETGEGIKTCTRCDHSETVIYETAAHNYKTGMEFPATCTRESLTQKICADCGNEIWLTGAKSDVHLWDTEWNGLRRCALCGKTQRISGHSSADSLLDGVTYQNQTQTPDTVLPSFRWDPKP